MSVIPDEVNPSAEIVPFDAETLAPLVTLAGGGVLTATSLQLEGEMDYETFEALGTMLGGFDRACRWWVGDWLLYGEGRFEADRYAQAASMTGLSEHTLLNRIWMSRAIPPNRRNPRVSYSAHRHIAALPVRQQTRWLSYAEEHRSSERELRAAIKLAEGVPAAEEEAAVDTHRAESEQTTTAPPSSLHDAAAALIENAEVRANRVIVRVEDYEAVVAALGEEE